MALQNTGAYKTTQIETADQKTLIIMLYDKAISMLRKAKKEIEAKEYEQKQKSICKARDIVLELLSALDMERGGIISAKLSALYDYVIREMMEADIKSDLKSLDNATIILSELREAWKGIQGAPVNEERVLENEIAGVDLCG